MTPEVISMTEAFEAASTASSTLLSGRYIYFGPFQIDQQRQEVSKNGMRLKLQGKVYQVLLILLEKPREVVTREELRQRLWPADTHVNYDANVNTTVNKLRLALGDSTEKPLYIETIPRKGYCLIVEPNFSDKAQTIVPLKESSRIDSEVEMLQPAANRELLRSDLWITIGVLGLILAGMLLGAGITRLWISHISPTPIPWP
ncbi:MAG TPA: winged helix-turn-helix domain-containing protein [Candidatus Saccharimonadales bacterium]|nr:winged helix-turn-helix domain-containing protein [Candidatus Saccharimonadales bacterium]